jgi:hypothetical protein
MAKRVELAFVLHYEAKLVHAGVEESPRVVLWSTTTRNHRMGVVDSDLVRVADARLDLYAKEVTVPLYRTGTAWRADDCIYAEITVASPTEEGTEGRMRDGFARFYLRELSMAARSTGHLSSPVALVVSQQGALDKGTITIQCARHETLSEVASWTFSEPTPFDYIPENAMFASLLVEKTFKGLTSVFGKRESGTTVPPTTGGISEFHCPRWNSVVDIPGQYYWIDDSEPYYDERFHKNLVESALRRYGRTPEWFRGVVNKQLAEKGDRFDYDFNEAVHVVALAINIPSLSCHYMSDVAYMADGKRKTVGKAGIEMFSDSHFLSSDDCEGLGTGSMRVGLDMKRGTWKDPTLLAAQAVLSKHRIFGPIGSVTAPKDGDIKGGKRNPVLIGTPEDARDDGAAGGHAWALMLSNYDLREYLRKTSGDDAEKLLEGTTIAPWEKHLQVHTVEGTGTVRSGLLPRKHYVHPSRREEEHDLHDRLKTATAYLSERESGMFSRAQKERQPLLSEDVPDAHPSHFYRHVASMMTDEFLKEGKNVVEFTWVYTKPRVPESPEMRQRFKAGPDRSGWSWGVAKRDILTKKEEAGLVATPWISSEERAVYDSMRRHVMPYYKHSLGESWEKAQRDRFAPILSSFNKGASEITRGRKAAGTPVRLPVVYRRDEFMATVQERGAHPSTAGPAWQHLLKTIEKRNKILSANAYFEPVSERQSDVKGLYNVVIELNVDT